VDGFPGKRNSVLRGAKQMRFAFVEEHRAQVPVERLCRIMNVTSREYQGLKST